MNRQILTQFSLGFLLGALVIALVRTSGTSTETSYLSGVSIDAIAGDVEVSEFVVDLPASLNKVTDVENIFPEVVAPEPLATEEEIELISLITMAEAEGEGELGQRLVIDTILNRVDDEGFPDTIYEVIYQKNQFSTANSERFDRCYVQDDIYQLVLEELQSRTNNEVVFFRTGQYHIYGTPAFKEGAHYFSTL